MTPSRPTVVASGVVLALTGLLLLGAVASLIRYHDTERGDGSTVDAPPASSAQPTEPTAAGAETVLRTPSANPRAAIAAVAFTTDPPSPPKPAVARDTAVESRATLSESARVFSGTADITLSVASMENSLGVVEGCRVDMTVAAEFILSPDGTVTLSFADWPLYSGHSEGNPVSRQWVYCFAPADEQTWGNGKSGPNRRIYSTSAVREGDSVVWPPLQVGDVGSLRVDVDEGSSPARAVGSATFSIDLPVLTDSGTEVIEDYTVYVIEFALDESGPAGVGGTSDGSPEGDEAAARTGDPNCGKRIPENPTLSVRSQLVQPEGEVFVYSAAFKTWKGPITGETTLRAGDAVRTGRGGRARVVFDDLQGARDTVDVSPNTLLNVPWDDPEPDDDPILAVKLWRGVVRIVGELLDPIESRCSPFNVRTPTVVVGTRGTDFLVTHDEETGVSTITVNEGVVEVWPADDPGDVHELLPGDSVTYANNEFVASEVDGQAWNELLLEFGLEEVGDATGEPGASVAESGVGRVLVLGVALMLVVGVFLGYRRMQR